MQDFVTIPTYLINELPQDKLYALIIFLSMADENGEIPICVRELMKKWKWSNTKVSNFIKTIEEKDIGKTEKRQKKDSVFIVNTDFFKYGKDEKKTEKRQKKDTQKDSQIFEDLQIILNDWNKLSEYGIEQIPEIGISNLQYQNLKSIAEKYGVDDVINTIQRIKISEFLQGRTSAWKISFGWFVKDENYQKVRSGKYDSGNKMKSAAEKLEDVEKQKDEELIGDEWVDL